MKMLGFALMFMMVWTASASAAKVYLKDGGVIEARKVWRAKGKVMVLVNRQSIAEFSDSEVNLKKTFVRKKRVAKPVAVAAPAPAPGAPAQVAAPAAGQPAKPADKKIALPSMPTKLPEREPPRGSEEGSIRKQKKEMEQRLNE
jgi:hypothetical protein